MTNPNPFYGGGHSMRTSYDFAFWALRNCVVYYRPEDQFIAPSIPIGSSSLATYGRVANCVQMAGSNIPMRYEDLRRWLQANNALISPTEAMRVRGAILLNQGALLVSLGDGRRLVYEENFNLVMKYLGVGQNPDTTFEYGARVPGLEYS